MAVNFITERLLGIDPAERYSHQPDDLDKRAYDLLHPADIYLEQEPSVGEWIRELVPSREGIAHYVVSLFPSAIWVPRYRTAWLVGDIVAGITIGLVVVPQALAYALLAQLTPAYGLYTSFTGAVLYWLFGTSKDIVIGTTAVGSLLVGQVITAIEKQYPGEFDHKDIAHSLSLLSGAALLLIGLLRLGWIVEFIPYIPVSAFVTAASITIMSTQVPTVLGIPGINTHEAPYKVMINTVKALPDTRLDAAIGLTCIALLFLIRDLCAFMEKRQPAKKRTWSFISSLRLTFAMLLYTLISYLVHKDLGAGAAARFRIVGHIDPGFQKAGLPQPAGKLLGAVLPQLPPILIILIVEHIAIAKAMGRQFNYSIDPSQEVVALGSANLFSPFVGGYVCTGSFGASAVLSKAGVRTPLAGLFSALVLVLALYVLTAVFYYIPNAALAGLIIHAVCNLVTPPKNLHKYWLLSPLELLIWVIGVVLAIFDSLETSIYVGIGLSLALMLIRIARTKGQFIGRVSTRLVEQKGSLTTDDEDHDSQVKDSKTKHHTAAERDIYLPLDRKDASNPQIQIETPYPGVFIYRFNESFNYLNQARHMMILVEHILKNTKRRTEEHYEKESDRLWNDPGPRKHENNDDDDNLLPFLRAVVLDFSTLNNIDITSIQGLVDLRTTLDRHCAPDAVELHFAHVHNRWTRRSLAVAGFGYPSAKNGDAQAYWQPAYTIAAVLDEDSASRSHQSRCSTLADEESATKEDNPAKGFEAGAGYDSTDTEVDSVLPHRKEAAVFAVDRPFFHVDLQAAVESAVRDARARDTRAPTCMLARPEPCVASC
ncbi:hypothetical protein NLU13_0837 [Sarocladium strictum]|uniref:STAS domain-containing protein n=1 Tax=Sarocladium strictum TaxID=5046 RepID=A0AA39LB66_SARSR|nr:hypothetical protein NLU13_0837 [Sarocladium strictum]